MAFTRAFSLFEKFSTTNLIALSKGVFYSSKTTTNGPLSSYRVLDMTRVLAGPYATMILGDLGAEIIKVEKIGDGDDTRSWGPPFVNNESCYFFSVNRNKKSISLDLKKPEGIEILKLLAHKCDILIENFVPGNLAKMGIGYEDLKESHPHLIYCSITGYGSHGPYHKRPGYDVIAASVGGLLSITGPENGDPCKVGVAMTDLATGLYAHGAIMAALLERNNTGKGQHIECNLLSTQVACLVNLASAYLNGGLETKRWGTAHASIVPYQAFPTKDGYITVGAGNNEQFKNLCHRLNLNDIKNEVKFKTNALRVENRVELVEILTNHFMEKTTSEWLNTFEGASFPYGPINSLSEVFSDPQVKHNELVQTIKHESTGNVNLIRPAVTFSSSQNKIRSAPPVLGQHTREILKNVLQMKDPDVDLLYKSKVIQ